jgi:hypothetical protein
MNRPKWIRRRPAPDRGVLYPWCRLCSKWAQSNDPHGFNPQQGLLTEGPTKRLKKKLTQWLEDTAEAERHGKRLTPLFWEGPISDAEEIADDEGVYSAQAAVSSPPAAGDATPSQSATVSASSAFQDERHTDWRDGPPTSCSVRAAPCSQNVGKPCGTAKARAGKLEEFTIKGCRKRNSTGPLVAPPP